MTDETKEPRQEYVMSEEEAQRAVEALNDTDKEMARDQECSKLIIGHLLMTQESVREVVEIYEGMQRGESARGHIRESGDLSSEQIEKNLGEMKKVLGEKQEEIILFTDLLRGVPLVEALRKNPNNPSWLVHEVRNVGTVLRYHREEPDEELQEYLGSVSGGVEHAASRREERAKEDGEESYAMFTEAKKRALKRAEKLDEELAEK